MDGRYVVLTGEVEWKEFRQGETEETSWQTEDNSMTESASTNIKKGTGTGKENRLSGDDENNLKLQISLRSVRIESGIPEEIEYKIHSDDKVLCTAVKDLKGQDAVTAPGSMIRVRGKIHLYESPANDGQFDSRLYYQQIQGYLFNLTDAEILAYSKTGNPLKAGLYNLRQKLSSVIDALYYDNSGNNDSSSAPGGRTSADAEASDASSSDADTSDSGVRDTSSSDPGEMETGVAGVTETSEQEASILKAMILGETGLLDPEIKELYQMSGIIHIVCISGLHISLIGMGFFKLLRRLRIPAAPAAVAASAVIFLYSEMTGMHASSFRAMIMFFLHLSALALGRTYDLLTALSFAAILLLIEQPMYICYSGFLFSFGAVIAIGVLAPALPTYLRPFAVSIVSLPVQLCNYYTFPLYSVLINLIVLPLMTFVMGGGLAAVGIGAVSSFLSGGVNTLVLSKGVNAWMNSAAAMGEYAGNDTGPVYFAGKVIRMCAGSVGRCLWPLARLSAGAVSVILKFYKFLCVFSQKLPGHTIVAGYPPAWTVVLYFAVFTAMIMAHEWKTGRAIRQNAAHEGTENVLYVGERWRTFLYKVLYWPRKHLPELLQTVSAAAVIIIILFARTDVPLTFCMLDVGQGDALFIRGKVCTDEQMKNGRNRSEYVNILVDGGSSGSRQPGRYILKPFLHYHGISHLDLAIVTHDDLDHCNGLIELLEDMGKPDAVSVGTVALPDIAAATRGSRYSQIEDLAKEKGIRVLYLSKGQKLSFSEGAGTARSDAREGLNAADLRNTGDLKISETGATETYGTNGGSETSEMPSEGLQLYCLHPSAGSAYEDTNACSVTLLLKFGNFSGLLTGDLEKEGEQDFLKNTANSGKISEDLENLDFLKVAHHGSAYATCSGFLREVQAGYALISCGKNNRYGHPAQETVRRITDDGMKILDTRKTGQITFLTNGKTVRILSNRP